MDWDFVVCDVFTDRPLAGNQLAVFPDARPIPEGLLQRLAREINFSETVFVYPATGGGDARIRIFTPAAELPFAGHPALGTAIVLAESIGSDEIRLETGVGVVPLRLERRGERPMFGRMTQPVPTVRPVASPKPLLTALGVERSELPIERYDNGVQYFYVALPSEDAVARLEPDLAAVARFVRAAADSTVGVSCFAGAGRHWKTRMFAPADGIPEDPATGSAAGPLACHLVRHGRIAFGEEIAIAQGAEIGRPSTLYARVDGSPERIERVEVGGSAVIVGRGAFDSDAVATA